MRCAYCAVQARLVLDRIAPEYLEKIKSEG